MLSCSVIPDKSASRLKMLVRPMWVSISSRWYVPEMENLGRCKSNRLERESERWCHLVKCAACALSVGNPQLREGEVFPRVRGSWSYCNIPFCARTLHHPQPPSFQALQTSSDLISPPVFGPDKTPSMATCLHLGHICGELSTSGKGFYKA